MGCLLLVPHVQKKRILDRSWDLKWQTTRHGYYSRPLASQGMNPHWKERCLVGLLLEREMAWWRNEGPFFFERAPRWFNSPRSFSFWVDVPCVWIIFLLVFLTVILLLVSAQSCVSVRRNIRSRHWKRRTVSRWIFSSVLRKRHHVQAVLLFLGHCQRVVVYMPLLSNSSRLGQAKHSPWLPTRVPSSSVALPRPEPMRLVRVKRKDRPQTRRRRRRIQASRNQRPGHSDWSTCWKELVGRYIFHSLKHHYGWICHCRRGPPRKRKCIWRIPSSGLF